ncbi:FmdB family zinc ribbon protein [Ottowia sp.]|uniref:FmdB family zinc ribbon protein n=1 Tax=Ottowia sp. TaxID=1898956 RepID=UPI003A83D24B
MPIYAYKCSACGFAKDVLQKMSDAPLTGCPQCGQAAFAKQVTAAGFQLKGSGWYVTDFRDGHKSKSGAAAPGDAASGDTAPEGNGNTSADAGVPAASPAPAAAPVSAPVPTPASNSKPEKQT